MAELHAGNRRRHLRFNSNAEETNDLMQRSMKATAHVDLGEEAEEFQPELLGFMVDQSHSGCSVVFQETLEICNTLKQGKECVVKAGVLHPMRAVVRWRNDMDGDLFKVGFQFLE